MSWQLLVLINILTISTVSLLQRSVLRIKNVNPIAFAIGFQLLVAVVIGTVTIFRGFHLPDLSLLWFNLFLAVVLYFTANILKFKALKTVEISEFIILFQFSTVTAVLVAIFLLGERFSLSQVLGLVLVIVAVVLVTWQNTKLKLTRNELVAIGSAVFFGAAFVNDAYILRTSDAFSYSFLAFLAPGLVTWGLYRASANPFTMLDKKIIVKVCLSVLLYAVGALSVYTAYQIGRNAAQISSINNTQTILIVILAAVFLKERDRIPRKMVAAALSVVGVILLG